MTQHLTMKNMDHACDDVDFTGQRTIVFQCGVPLLIFNLNHGNYYVACTYDDVAHTYLRRAHNLRDEEDCSV